MHVAGGEAASLRKALHQAPDQGNNAVAFRNGQTAAGHERWLDVNHQQGIGLSGYGKG
ncbi:MAG: hypothetical protein ACREUU_07825 [Gammaproteobacteria bacterium]